MVKSTAENSMAAEYLFIKKAGSSGQQKDISNVYLLRNVTSELSGSPDFVMT